jgi:hypothetical protein
VVVVVVVVLARVVDRRIHRGALGHLVLVLRLALEHHGLEAVASRGGDRSRVVQVRLALLCNGLAHERTLLGAVLVAMVVVMTPHDVGRGTTRGKCT